MTNLINNASSRRAPRPVAQTLMRASPWLLCRKFPFSSAVMEHISQKWRGVCLFHQVCESASPSPERRRWRVSNQPAGIQLSNTVWVLFIKLTQLFGYSATYICLASRASACRCVGNNIMLLTNAFKGKFIIPNFAKFTQQIDKMYDSAYQQEAGQVSPPAPHTHTHDRLISLPLFPSHWDAFMVV